MLIAQPRKINDDRVMGIEDLKDSNAIGADADCVIVLYRKKVKGKDGVAESAFEPPRPLSGSMLRGSGQGVRHCFILMLRGLFSGK